MSDECLADEKQQDKLHRVFVCLFKRVYVSEMVIVIDIYRSAGDGREEEKQNQSFILTGVCYREKWIQ